MFDVTDVMKKIHNLISPPRLRQKYVHSLIFALTIMGLVATNWGFSTKVMAQNPKFNNTEILNYAQALLEIEPVRQEAFEKIKTAINGREVPEIVCNKPSSINGLSGEVKKIAVEYCVNSQKIVEKYGLTSEIFNKITVEVQSNNELKRQVYNTLLRLQKTPQNR
ncbi:MAG TPA: DUF4168 domain-containing protein [Nostocaceae cyanobacterium]|nr:DUF4168 domain-containing protein [Nostocaceae cyanobacterium]